MINSIAWDVEVFKNLFSVTFIDLRDYLQTFSDCVNDKGEAIPMTDKLTVKEIEARLDKVKCASFYISDTDDSQLLELVAYINKLAPHKEADGSITISDLFAYNSLDYDNLMIAWFMMRFNRVDNTKELIKELYEFSHRIITIHNEDKQEFYKDAQLDVARKYKLPFRTVDLFKLFGLNSVSARYDKDTGARTKLAKGLKGVSINLKWYQILDFKLPPIDEEEQRLYWDKTREYRYCKLEYLNSLNIGDFDRYILPKYVPSMLHYNKNDVFIVCEIVRQKPDEIKLRYSISAAFNVNLLSAARSKISKELFTQMYSKATGLRPFEFNKKRTNRNRLTFKNIIFPHISFQTPELQSFLEDMKKVVIYHTSKKEFNKTLNFRGTTYTIATGGIHSVDAPRELRSNDKYVYIHHD